MESVTINGVEYRKASILAKQFRYTTDYIGQLCRGRKVDAKLIGRTWYVNEASLVNHKTQKKSSVKDELVYKNSAEITKSRLAVSAVPKGKTIKLATSVSNHDFPKRISWQPARYEADAEELVPTMKSAVDFRPQRLRIDVAGSKSVKVVATKIGTKFTADPLPAVALSGTLKVLSMEIDHEAETYPEDDIASISNVFSVQVEDRDRLQQVMDEPYESMVNTKLTAVALAKTVDMDTYKVPLSIDKSSYYSRAPETIEVETLARASFVPQRLRQQSPSRFDPDVVITATPVSSRSIPWWLWTLLVASLLALATVLLLDLSLTVTSSGVSTGILWRWSW